MLYRRSILGIASYCINNEKLRIKNEKNNEKWRISYLFVYIIIKTDKLLN